MQRTATSDRDSYAAFHRQLAAYEVVGGLRLRGPECHNQVLFNKAVPAATGEASWLAFGGAIKPSMPLLILSP